MKGLTFDAAGMIYYFGIPLAGRRKNNTDTGGSLTSIQELRSIHVIYLYSSEIHQVTIYSWLNYFFRDIRADLVSNIQQQIINSERMNYERSKL